MTERILKLVLLQKERLSWEKLGGWHCRDCTECRRQAEEEAPTENQVDKRHLDDCVKELPEGAGT